MSKSVTVAGRLPVYVTGERLTPSWRVHATVCLVHPVAEGALGSIIWGNMIGHAWPGVDLDPCGWSLAGLRSPKAVPFAWCGLSDAGENYSAGRALVVLAASPISVPYA